MNSERVSLSDALRILQDFDLYLDRGKDPVLDGMLEEADAVLQTPFIRAVLDKQIELVVSVAGN